jgi:hypothetical protein
VFRGQNPNSQILNKFKIPKKVVRIKNVIANPPEADEAISPHSLANEEIASSSFKEGLLAMTQRRSPLF